jgi:hypothetical protein
VTKIESSEGAILGRTKQSIKAPRRLIDKKNELCVGKTKIGWKEYLIKVDDEALKTMDKLIKWKENVVAREVYFVSDGEMAADEDPQARGSVGLRENGGCFDVVRKENWISDLQKNVLELRRLDCEQGEFERARLRSLVRATANVHVIPSKERTQKKSMEFQSYAICKDVYG